MTLALLTGCATGAPINVQKEINAWVGRDADALVRAWGPPDRSYNFRDGSTVLEYERNRIDNYGWPHGPHGAVAIGNHGSAFGIGVPLWQDEPRIDIRRCVIQFESGKNRVIRRGFYTGENCAYALRNVASKS